MAAAADLRSLEETSTWAVAVVCFVLVAISIFIEKALHHLGKFLMIRQKRALYEALEKVKSELMLLGFISLLLTVGQNLIAEICVTTGVGNSWAPCSKTKSTVDSYDQDDDKISRRKLLQVIDHGRRFLAGGGGGVDMCVDKGKVPLISTDGINQLHVFIFVLAIFHILHSIATLLFGKLKMKSWKTWEEETETAEYEFSQDPERFRFARDTSFGRRHLSYWSKSSILIWIVCFFRQFATTVSKTDYLTLRHGFITAHLSPQSSMNFNFLKYIQRSLEEDFQVVVGISPVVWFFAVLFLLFNTHGWYSYYWLPFIPLIIILTVSVKLQVIITRMALRIMEHDDVVKGVPIVHPADNLFWFNRPKLLLNLIHFVLFQNAFQVAFFVWSWYEFGINSCFHEKMEIIVIIVTMGVVVQIVCSYITLPLYALVTQMGSNMKPVIFNERVATALRSWHHTARKHLKQTQKSDLIKSTSPVHLPQNHSHYSYAIEKLEDGKGTQNQFYSTEGTSSYHHSSNQGKSGMVEEMKIQAITEEMPKTTYSSFSFENTQAHEINR